MTKLKFDSEKLDFVKDKRNAWWYLKRGLWLLQVSILLSLFYYFLGAVFLNTEDEKHLLVENRAIAEEYDRLEADVERLENVVSGLGERNRGLYHSLFESYPVETGTGSSELVYSGDMEDFSMRRYTQRMSAVLDECLPKLKKIDDRFVTIGKVVRSGSEKQEIDRIPSKVPVKNFSLSRVGANSGRKMHPFYKKFAEHQGLDFLVPVGTDVLASASGTVEDVSRGERRGDRYSGSIVVINHGNGYVTRYTHLSDIYVRKGQVVQQGRIIGKSGESGRIFAPALHYEVTYMGKYMDPIHYMFADLNPVQYVEVIKTAMNQGQSMD